jgi:hypothetical protein
VQFIRYQKKIELTRLKLRRSFRIRERWEILQSRTEIAKTISDSGLTKSMFNANNNRVVRWTIGCRRNANGIRHWSSRPSIRCLTNDHASRLQTITQGTSTTTITYDNANRRSTLTMPNGLVLTYGYDTDSRVTSTSYQFGSNNLGNLTYTYDANGRSTQVGGSFARTGFPQAVSSAQYDVANELTQWNGVNISYDANGNITNDGVSTYSWNARNQMAGRGSVTFQYDGYGRRTVNAAGNSLLYQGFDVTQELSGTTPVANRIVGGVDEFFARSDSGGSHSPLTDALGITLALVDSSGNLATQYAYDPFGTSGSASSSNRSWT